MPQPFYLGTGISTVKMAAKFDILTLYRTPEEACELNSLWSRGAVILLEGEKAYVP